MSELVAGTLTTDTDIRWWWAFEMLLLSFVGFDGRGGKFNPHMMEFGLRTDIGEGGGAHQFADIAAKVTEHELEIALNVQVQPHCLAPIAAASQSRL